MQRKLREIIKLGGITVNREERAKQFMAFDALKGLQESLRMKEYEHEKVAKGELSEEEASKLSKKLLQIEKGDIVEVKYYDNGHYKTIEGNAKIDYVERFFTVDSNKILFDNIANIKIKKKQN